MKKRFYLLISLAILISACGPQNTQHPVEISDALFTATAAPTEESAPVAALAAQETPLPAIDEAPIAEAPELLSIDMVDKENGWALTEQQIVRTNDGGVTWYNVTPQTLKEVGYFIYADFLSATHAWLQLPDMNNMPNGGTLYRTHDGGLTWEEFTTPFSDGSLQFVDEQNGWMMANLGAGAGSNAVSIFITRDGGATWRRTYTNDSTLEGASDTLPLNGMKNFILPLDENTAWVGGVVYAPGQVYLFRTDDGGKTWFNINLILPEGVEESELSLLGMAFSSPTEGALALRISAETAQTALYTTTNAGNTWALTPIRFEGYGKLAQPAPSEAVFYYADQFHVTTDAGETIQTITPDVSFGDTILTIDFVSAQLGWVITEDETGNRSLYRTEDGGAAWFAQIP